MATVSSSGIDLPKEYLKVLKKEIDIGGIGTRENEYKRYSPVLK